jgi:hypothetical protein
MSIQQDYNSLKTNAFNFVLSRIPETAFRVQACNLPSVYIPTPEENPPGILQSWSGTDSRFEELTIKFVVDENLRNYRELYNWITMQRYAARTNEVAPQFLESELYSDGALITLTNASNPNIVFSFKNLFPISISELSFDTTVPVTQITCQVVFRYSYFTMGEEVAG